MKGLKLEGRYLLRKNFQRSKDNPFFSKFNLNFSCPPITLNLGLKFYPRGTPQECARFLEIWTFSCELKETGSSGTTEIEV